MTNNNNISASEILKKDFWSNVFFRNQNNNIITNFEDNNNKEIFNKIKNYSFSYKNKFYNLLGLASSTSISNNNFNSDDDYYILDPRYDESQLEQLEDCYNSDPAVNAAINKQVYAIVGPHGKTVLDTKKEFSLEEDRRKEIKSIVNNNRYQQAKIKVDSLLTSEQVNFHSQISDFVHNYLVFGRACFYIIRGDNQRQQNGLKQQRQQQDNNSSILKNIILLDSKRLGRVKIDKKTLSVIAVEYLDVEEDEQGNIRPALPTSSINSNFGINDFNSSSSSSSDNTSNFLPITDLFYLPHTSGSIATSSKYVGYSKIESIIHISQVKRIIMNENIKEAAKTHYAGIGRFQFDPNTPDELISNFVSQMKNATGKWFAHKLPVQEFSFDKMPTDLDKYPVLIDAINREIIRCIGLPSFLLGYEQIANYANSEQIMIAQRELDIAHLRTKLKDFIQYKILNPLFENFLLLSSYSSSSTIPLSPQISQQPNENNNNEEDAFVKLTYEFQDVNFSTKLEIAEMYRRLKSIIPAIPSERILRDLGLDDIVEEVQITEAQQQQQQRQQQLLSSQQQQSKNNNNDEDNNNGDNKNGSLRPEPTTSIKTGSGASSVGLASSSSSFSYLSSNDPLMLESQKELMELQKKCYQKLLSQ